MTGVSSGALVAPFAFLGPSWDEEMTGIFTTGETDGLLQSRGLGAVFGSSVYSGEPLRRLIERYADDAMIAAIAAEAAKGRLLLVATTDFDSGEPVIWDLGSIALHGDKNAKPLIQTLLLASASVPGMLPPVTVRFRSQGKAAPRDPCGRRRHVAVLHRARAGGSAASGRGRAAVNDRACHHRWATAQSPAPDPRQRLLRSSAAVSPRDSAT